MMTPIEITLGSTRAVLLMFFLLTVYPSPAKLVRTETTPKDKADSQSVPPVRKRKGRTLRSHLPKKMKRKAATPKAKTSKVTTAGKKGKAAKSSQRPAKTRQDFSETTDSEQTSSADSGKREKYFPFRILDESCPHTTLDMPFLGLSKPSFHADTFPRLCSRGLTEVRVVPSADRQGFENFEGYWRLMIAGLNRRTVINAIFMPKTPKKSGDAGEEPEHGVFLSALATGAFSSWYTAESLLNRAQEELSGRRMVFVLDAYSHGEEKVEVVINRAY